jgi:hypothetical protein
MDVVRLGERYTTSYVPDELIEGYSSMIWTERFFTPGEFQLVTPRIEETKLLLPEDTLISHLETDEVMMVENHAISTDAEGNEVLVVTGRDLKTMLEHRYIEAPYQKRRKMRKNYTAVAGLAVLLWNSFDNNTGKDVTRGDPNPWDDNTAAQDYSWNTQDRIPNIAITDSVPVDGAAVAKGWWLNEGDLWTQFYTFMKRYDIGFRAIRPHSGSSGEVITVDHTPLADRGNVIRTATSGITALRFDLYKGVNRSHSQDVNPKVAFSTLQGDLDEAQYLWSRKDYKTIVEIMSGGTTLADQGRNATQKAFTGWKRRVGSVDAGSPDIPAEPERPKDLRKNATNAEKEAWRDDIDDWRVAHGKWTTKKNNILAEFKSDAEDMAKAYLRDHNQVALLSGNISPASPFRYGVHYGLGDRVTIHGNHEMVYDMIVTEYVRTDDMDGDRGFPGVSLPGAEDEE